MGLPRGTAHLGCNITKRLNTSLSPRTGHKLPQPCCGHCRDRLALPSVHSSGLRGFNAMPPADAPSREEPCHHRSAVLPTLVASAPLRRCFHGPHFMCALAHYARLHPYNLLWSCLKATWRQRHGSRLGPSVGARPSISSRHGTGLGRHRVPRPPQCRVANRVPEMLHQRLAHAAWAGP